MTRTGESTQPRIVTLIQGGGLMLALFQGIGVVLLDGAISVPVLGLAAAMMGLGPLRSLDKRISGGE